MDVVLQEVSRRILTIPNFPQEGIHFKDITPVLSDPQMFSCLIELMAREIPREANKLVAIESRGFILGSALAHHLGLGLVLARKPGKLPRETLSETYSLEYGTDTLQIHRDDLSAEDQVVIIDDVLATGGTAAAVERLCLQTGCRVLRSLYLMEISVLGGNSRLRAPAVALLQV